jgi:capsular exopolysaccharide synthesis family protein
MENFSSQSSSYNQSKNSVPAFIHAQPSPWSSEEQEEEWNLQEFIGIVRRRVRVIAVVAATVMAIVVVLTLNKKPEYESSFRLLVEPVNNDTRVLDLFKDPNLTKSGLDYDSQIQVLKSPEVMNIIVQQLQSSYPDINYGSLLGSLTITRLGETKILEVRYRSNDPMKVKVVLDTIAKEYLDYSLENRQSKLHQGIEFVEKQLPSLKGRVNRLQRDLQIFRQKYDFIDPDIQAQQINRQISTLSDQRQTINQQLAQARANLASLQQKDGDLSALNNATVYQQLIVQLRQLDTQIALESTRFQDDNPTIQALKQKRENLLPLLRDEAQRFLNVKVAEIATEVQTLEVKSQELAKAEQRLEQRRKQLPVLTRQYTELQRGLQVATDSLNRFLATRETLQIQGAQTELSWHLIQAPYKPEQPISSANPKNSLLMGLAAGIAAGIGAALLLEKLDKTYHTAHTLKEKSKLPLIGNLPFEKQLKNSQFQTSKQKTLIFPPVRLPKLLLENTPGLTPIATQEYSNYSVRFLEALRVLYTNIQLLSSDRPLRSIIMSSAMAADGKSTVAFHLAQIATAMGQRVLLVDADLRQPTIHSLSNLNNQWGLSNLISMNLPIEEVVQQLPSMSQLSVITAGPIPPDATKLLSSHRMKRLMEEFHHNFDLVIYDTPALLGLADATLLAPHTDGIVLVVRINKTDSVMLKRALDSLQLSRINVLGVVANGQRSNFDSY